MMYKSVARASRGIARVVIALMAMAVFAGATEASVVISTAATQNMSCSGGVCTPTAPQANLNVTDLANMLASADVSVATGTASKDIRFGAPLSWISSSRLTLDAHKAIVFEQPVTVAGTGAMTISTKGARNGGDYLFAKKGHIEFWDAHSSLVVNGKNFTLVKTLPDLAKRVLKKNAGRYALAGSYDASQDGVYTQPPISEFGGVFEGLGNHINRFAINFTTKTEFYGAVGLIGELYGLVQNLNLDDVKVTCAIPDDDVGALAGRSSGSIKSVMVTGHVEGYPDPNVDDNVGGIVGFSYGPIANSYSTARVKNGAWTGGLVGTAESEPGIGIASITNSGASGKVSSHGNAGGLAAAAYGAPGFIVGSSARGDVDSLLAAPNIGNQVGGLVADNRVNVSNSYSTGNVTGGGAGNIVGGAFAYNSASIANTFASGDVASSNCNACGGLVGANSGPVATSYSTGLVSGSGSWTGGVIGDDSTDPGSITDAYWDLDTSGISDPAQGAGNKANDPGITGLTDAQLKSALPTGFDPQVWGQNPNINNGYPYLLANPPPK